jgi:hypothetical protein
MPPSRTDPLKQEPLIFTDAHIIGGNPIPSLGLTAFPIISEHQRSSVVNFLRTPNSEPQTPLPARQRRLALVSPKVRAKFGP